MGQYQQKPPTIEAVQWTGDIAAVQAEFPDAIVNPDDDQICMVPAMPMGTYMVAMNSWITRDANGSVSYTDDEYFQRTYEAATTE